MDQGISPVVDYLHINLTDFLGIRCVDNAKSLGIRHGGPKRGTDCTIGVVQRGWHNNMVKCRRTHKAKVQCFKVNGKFLFIFVTLTILVTAICLSK